MLLYTLIWSNILGFFLNNNKNAKSSSDFGHTRSYRFFIVLGVEMAGQQFCPFLAFISFFPFELRSEESTRKEPNIAGRSLVKVFPLLSVRPSSSKCNLNKDTRSHNAHSPLCPCLRCFEKASIQCIIAVQFLGEGYDEFGNTFYDL